MHKYVRETKDIHKFHANDLLRILGIKPKPGARLNLSLDAAKLVATLVVTTDEEVTVE
jgi:hypothetical protein